MDVLLSFLVLGFLVWWGRHHELYKAGKVKNPFFSLGRKAPNRFARRSPRRYPRSAASTATATPRAMAAAVRQISTYTHNPAVAARLLESTRRANMGQTLPWCVDKTIADILRDRR